MKHLIHNVGTLLKRNSPAILSSTAIVGVVSTAYLASKATLDARDKIRAFESIGGTHADRTARTKERTKLCWKLYMPAVGSGAATIACIIGTTRVSGKRAAAAQAAFVITERAYSEYRNKVIEEYGESKDRSIRDSVATDRVNKNPPPSAEILVTGPGNVLCCELHTGRYFACDMESLRKAQNDLNFMLINQDVASLDELYWMIGLQPTTHSSELGWNSDKKLEFEFTSVLTDDGRPCLAFNYNYVRPLYDGNFG